VTGDEKGCEDRCTWPGCRILGPASLHYHLHDLSPERAFEPTPDDTAAPQAYVPFNAQGERDDTQPPDHYRTSYHGNVVPAGTELIDWIVAMRGKEFAIDAMTFEIQTKANRLGIGSRKDKVAEDCFKIRQACRVIERLEGEE